MNKPPSFWRRVGAYLVDTIILVIVLIAVQYILVGITGGRLQVWLFETNNKLLSYGYVLLTVSFVPFNLYFSLLESSPRQATLGKRLFGLKVADMKSRRIDLFRAVARTSIKFLPWELGHISMMFFTNLTVIGISHQGFPFTNDTQFLTESTSLSMPTQVLAWLLLTVNILFVLLHRQKRGLYDLIAGTSVEARHD